MLLHAVSSALLCTFPTVLGADTKPYNAADIRGLDPARRYSASDKFFTCLDGSKNIPVAAINDDYCDCLDGSDEPGTSACEGVGNGDGWFHCKNEGHIPGKVRRSRVNDGICDPECCDGSDEWVSGACPNQCAEIGKEHRAKVEQERKTRKTGSKIRGTYVKWAINEKKRLEDELEQKRAEISAKESEVESARTRLERTEAKSKEDLERRKATPLYTHLLSQKLALTRLRSKTSRLQSELDILHNILDELKKGYNPNYQDMAVKAAVVGYDEFLNPPAAAIENGDGEEVKPAVEEVEEEITDRELDDMDRKDLETLLLSDIIDNDEDEDDEGGILYRIDEYIPDVLYDHWESVRDFTIDWMIRIGFLGKGSKGASKTTSEGPHVAAAREAHNKATSALNNVRNDIKRNEDTLQKMKTDFGPDSEWKKLDGTCIDTEYGDYTWELCFFGRISQKSNKDSSTNHIGTYSGWETSAPVGSFEYYSRQYYKNGARCWNGPLRSAVVDWSCGVSNALISIAEPEKCEYFIKATTPALCYPLEEEKVKYEL